MIDALIGILVIVNFYIWDKVRDSHHYAPENPWWHDLFHRPRWVPDFLYQKVQNWWHVGKQIGILPLVLYALWQVVESLGWKIILITALLAQGVWEIMPSPEHWGN